MRWNSKHIRWVKICEAVLSAGVGIGIALAMVNPARADTEYMTYSKTVKTGDTLWSIVGEIATEKEDVREIIYRVMRDNHISDPANLQPGDEIIIRVKEAKNL